MTEIQFIKLVKEMRRVQADYQRTNNMRLKFLIDKMEKQVDTAIKEYERINAERLPVQQDIPNLFDDKTQKEK